MTTDTQEPTIIFTSGTSKMLRIAKDKFYRVNQDDKEAELVYNKFHQWLT